MKKQLFDDIDAVLKISEHIKTIAGSEENVKRLLNSSTSFGLLADLGNSIVTDALCLFPHQTPREKEQNGVPFHLQGDTAFEQSSALEKRKELRNSSAIRTEVRHLWDVSRSRTVSFVNRMDSILEVEILSRDQYMKLMLLVYKALREDFEIELATNQINQDWAADSQYGEHLSFELFFSAIYELVDLWTCDLNEETYIQFLKLLVRRITIRVIVFIDGQELNLAISDNHDNVEAIIIRAIPLQTIPAFHNTSKALRGCNIHTIGELAAADVQEIEKERQLYLAKMNFSIDKKGKHLQQLLSMFGSISTQFCHRTVAKLPQDTLSKNIDNETILSSDDINADIAVSIEPEPPLSSGFIDSGSSRGASSAKRAVSNINELASIDATMIDSFKAAYIIEKNISLDRADVYDDMTKELMKFGVDPAGLTEEQALHEYNTLYELLVVRDGEDIRKLAQMVLQQIRMELTLHGIFVDDVDLEAYYDEFYSSVVDSTGEKMTQDAKDWISKNEAQTSLSMYVAKEYHILKELQDVQYVSELDEDSNLDMSQSRTTMVEEYTAPDTQIDDHLNPAAEEYSLSCTSSALPTDSSIDTVDIGGNSTIASDSKIENVCGPSSCTLFEDAIILDGDMQLRQASDAVMTCGLQNLAELQSPLEAVAIQDSQTLEDAVDGGVDESDGTEERCQNTLQQQNNLDSLELISEGAQLKQTVSEHFSMYETTSDGAEQLCLESEEAHSTLYIAKPQRMSVDLLQPGEAAPEISDQPYDSILAEESNCRLKQATAVTDAHDLSMDAHSALPVWEAHHRCDEDVRVPKIPRIVLGGLDGATTTANVLRYIRLLDLGIVYDAGNQEMLLKFLITLDGLRTDLVCFDVSDRVDQARNIIVCIQSIIGNRLIIFGGDPGDISTTEKLATICMQESIIYFAALPINFTLLRSELFKYFEHSTRTYLITRQAREAHHALTVNNKIETTKKPVSINKDYNRNRNDAAIVLPMMKHTTTPSAKKNSNPDEVRVETYPLRPKIVKQYKNSPRRSTQRLI